MKRTESKPKSNNLTHLLWGILLLSLFTPSPSPAFSTDILATNEWTRLSIGGTKPAYEGYGMSVFDSNRGRLYYLGGDWNRPNVDTIYGNSLWAFDFETGAWTRKTLSDDAARLDYESTPPAYSSNHPNKRHPFGGMAFIPDRNGVFLFGGVSYHGVAQYDDTWFYDSVSNRWTDLAPSFHPGNKNSHSLVYVPDRKEVVMFGGHHSSSGLYEPGTWIYSFESNNWQYLSIPGPTRRDGAVMTYDSISKKVILFGGWYGDAFLSDTWVFDPSSRSWANASKTVRPPAREGSGLVFVADRNLSVLVGGHGPSGIVNDMWSFDTTSGQWTEVFPGRKITTSTYTWYNLAYDNFNNVLLLIQGSSEPNNYDAEVWAYKFGSSGSSSKKPNTPQIQGIL